jgi:NAD(P)-dependent dehydrogenase (short-subunit alcohol dehydrogenase family)
MPMYADLAAAEPGWRYRPSRDLLAGRVILVTGAGDGIGRCAARTFAAYGADVVLLGRTQQKLEDVFDAIVDETSTDPTVVPCDLETAPPEAYVELKEQILDHYGRLDGLLHNAGILGPRVPIEFYAAADWRRVMKVNLDAMVALTQGVLPALKQSTEATIAITSSSVGRAGRAYWGAYAAAKFAAEGFAQVLADELANAGRVRVRTLNPGATRTSMRAAAYPGEDPATVASPESKIDLYLYLFGPDARGRDEIQWDAKTWSPRREAPSN